MDFIADCAAKPINVYLDADEDEGYESALLKYINRYDRTKLKQYKEMERQYRDVAESVIIPALKGAGHDLGRAYQEIEPNDSSPYSKRQVIGILSWFRNNGYSNALGNGSISSEVWIDDDYHNDPWKFVYEFMQNVDDCTFGEGAVPTLKMSIDQENGRLAFEYNEAGFTLDDIKALTKFGDSNKGSLRKRRGDEDGLVDRGQTGRMGRGFKSVFALPGDDIVVHVCSNGYTFKFAKQLGYIIPIWEDVNDAPAEGTRIAVEGIEASYIDNLAGKINDMLGASGTSHFFQTCPALFLKQLRSLVALDGAHAYSVDIRACGSPIYGDIYQTGRRRVVSGIYQGGELRYSLTEELRIVATADGTVRECAALRHSKLFSSDDNTIWAVSAMAPIIRRGEDKQFETGALYCTLPLSGHRLDAPLAINAPFIPNPARSAIDDKDNDDRSMRPASRQCERSKCKSWNDELVNQIVDSLLPRFFLELSTIEGIRIEEYLPTEPCVLFEDYENVETLRLEQTIKSIPMIKPLAGTQPVSLDNAVVLPAECYAWPRPDLLCVAFGGDANKLVGRQYAASREVPRLVEELDLAGRQFVAGINAYMRSLDLGGDALLSLLKGCVYPYIKNHFEDIRAQYLMLKRQSELKDMRIFAFEMADGSLVLESAGKDTVWFDNEGDEYRSFGRHRCLSGSSLEGVWDANAWIREDIRALLSRDTAFTAGRLGTKGAMNWGAARDVVETVLYYEVEDPPIIPLLDGFALSDEIDATYNTFRNAFERTGDTAILRGVIGRSELEDLAKDSFAWDVPLEEIAGKLKAMGLRRPDDFFDEKEGVVSVLSKRTIAMLRGYCRDSLTTSEVLDAIGHHL